MASTHVVVDGSNIATEGRSTPSLKQLDEAVRAFLEEHPHDKLTVVVDATFGHRIDPSERAAFDEAIANNEMVTPPAGAIGRGDAFVLEIADRANALVLSNDSFQEFHGTHTWLFDEGRLIGGKPVPDVGWVFVSRTPVRGATSQRAVRDARKRNSRTSEPTDAPAARNRSTRSSTRSGSGRERSSDAAETTRAATDSSAGASSGARRSRGGRGRGSRVGDSGVSSATGEGPAKTPAKKAAGASTSSGRSQAKTDPTAEAPPKRASVNKTNDPLPFIEFVANFPVGSTVSGEVEQFSSHGAYVLAGGARCYVALKALGDPAPRSARDVLDRGEVRDFVVLAFDTPRRGIDLILPGLPNTPAPPTAEDASPKAASARRAATKKATEGAPRTGAAPLKSQRVGDGVQDAAPATKKKGGIAEAAKKLIGRKK